MCGDGLGYGSIGCLETKWEGLPLVGFAKWWGFLYCEFFSISWPWKLSISGDCRWKGLQFLTWNTEHTVFFKTSVYSSNLQKILFPVQPSSHREVEYVTCYQNFLIRPAGHNYVKRYCSSRKSLNKLQPNRVGWNIFLSRHQIRDTSEKMEHSR